MIKKILIVMAVVITKAFCLFMNMDKMIGGQFENGLADLKAITEAPTK